VGDYSPKFKPGADITLAAGGTIVGGNVLVISGVNTVTASAGTSTAFAGVARQDAATGEKVVVTRGGVQKLIASGAITAGDRVAPAAGGKAASSATNAFGNALTTVADGAVVLVLMDK
jgi:hypothetical protein